MDQPESIPVRGASYVFDAVLTLAVFAFFTWVASDHVPSNDPVDIWVWAAITSSCLTGVFWLGLQMFHAVYRKQRAERKK